jgi:hypothetical protein
MAPQRTSGIGGPRNACTPAGACSEPRNVLPGTGTLHSLITVQRSTGSTALAGSIGEDSHRGSTVIPSAARNPGALRGRWAARSAAPSARRPWCDERSATARAFPPRARNSGSPGGMAGAPRSRSWIAEDSRHPPLPQLRAIALQPASCRPPTRRTIEPPPSAPAHPPAVGSHPPSPLCELGGPASAQVLQGRRQGREYWRRGGDSNPRSRRKPGQLLSRQP